MRSRIIVISRDAVSRGRLARMLMNGGYRAEVAESIARARRAGLKGIALAIIESDEVGTPQTAAVEELRAAVGRVLFVAPLSARLSSPDSIDPSDEARLLARVRQGLATRARAGAAESMLEFEGYRLDLAGHSLRNPAGREVRLRPAEFSLLRAFAQRAGRVLSRDQLLHLVAGRDAEPYDRSIDMQIVRLRRKIEPDPKRPRIIVTVPGSGYKFATEAHEAKPTSRREPEPDATPVPSDDGPRAPARRHGIALAAELAPARSGRLPSAPEVMSSMIGVAAIMVGDIVGYFAMMEKSEEKTVARLATCQTLISEKVASLGGRIFKRADDATLAEFSSPIHALRCAVEIGVALAGIEASEAEPLKMRFGVHLADLVVEGDDLVGDGVNLAVRLQQAAEPGAVWVSGVLFDHIRRNSPFSFDDLGERRFKNLSEPIRIYRVRGEMGAHRFQSAPTRFSGDAPKRPSSVAVMPFRVLTGEEEQRFLAEGLTEELIVELGRFRRLRVASRSASFALADTYPHPINVGEALRVQYVLDGQIGKIGKSIRIGLTLSETDAGSVVWSDKITRPFESLLDVLNETVPKIAATVAGRVEDASIVAARRKPPDNIEAFECFLRGIDYHRLGGVTDDNAREAVRWFGKAIEADPNYAAAYAWRVCAASWLPEFNLDEGERDIRRALELDSCDPEANRILGFIEMLKSNFEVAKALSLKAMELNPTDAYIKARSAAVMTYVGEPLVSLSLLDEAEALDPLLPVWCIEERGIALYALERYHEALEALGGLVFQTYRSRLYRAAALIALERPDEARRLVGEAIAGNAPLTTATFMTKEWYRDLEKRQALQTRLEKAGLPP